MDDKCDGNVLNGQNQARPIQKRESQVKEIVYNSDFHRFLELQRQLPVCIIWRRAQPLVSDTGI